MERLNFEIFKVLSFYSIFDFPLTPFEIYKNLGVPAVFHDVYRVLEDEKQKGQLIEEGGYYSLPQQVGGGEIRKTRFLISLKKIELAKMVARVFFYFPFIRFVGICNSLGYLNSSENSDIDFFVITRRGHIWIARFLCVTFLKIFNLRPTRENTKNKICLSFLISDEKLDISEIALSDGDPYLNHWMGWIMPLRDDGIYRDFIKENIWIKKVMPNFIEQGNSAVKPFPLFRDREKKFLNFWKMRFLHLSANAGFAHRIMLKWLGVFVKRLAEFFLEDWSNGFAKQIQVRVMPESLRDARKREDRGVVLSDTMLKFHLLDRRAEYRQKYYEKIKVFESGN